MINDVMQILKPNWLGHFLRNLKEFPYSILELMVCIGGLVVPITNLTHPQKSKILHSGILEKQIDR